eukprot:SAG11_NODE_1268_length_5342_cov_1.710853_9_plen_93_part_00
MVAQNSRKIQDVLKGSGMAASEAQRCGSLAQGDTVLVSDTRQVSTRVLKEGQEVVKNLFRVKCDTEVCSTVALLPCEKHAWRESLCLPGGAD